MTRNHKAISLFMAMIFCVSLMAPLLLAPQTAQATGVASALTVTTTVTGNDQDLGILRIYDAGNTITSGTRFTVTLPSGVKFLNTPAALNADEANIFSYPAALAGVVLLHP